MKSLFLTIAILSQGVWASTDTTLHPQPGVYKHEGKDGSVAMVTIKDQDQQDINFDVTIEVDGSSFCSFKSEIAQRPDSEREQDFAKEIYAKEGQCEVMITSKKKGQISVKEEAGSLCTVQCGAGASLDIPVLILQKQN